MSSHPAWRALHHSAKRRAFQPATPYRCFSCTRQTQNQFKSEQDRMTHFGFTNVPESEKDRRCLQLRRIFLRHNERPDVPWNPPPVERPLRALPEPGLPLPAGPHRKGWNILDIAGGTGDIAFRMLDHATNINHDIETRVTISDINADMLAEGRKRSVNTPYYNTPRLDFVEANAEHMPHIPSASVDLYTVVFGIRNFTDKQAALNEAYRVLKPGGVFACMEFSKVDNPVFDAIYKRWNFSAIPMIGQLVAGDRDSYQYLVESIEQFPSQDEFRGMIQKAGFMIPGKGYENLTGGIAAIHKGIKPIVKV
ncbi:Peptidase S10 serine carboxypeptidase [Penicillium atrosanguineum]|uniref:Peptidase S10 serine carboxypeptidase n=1 Tax=Penicillium atrosanguineum TaxID=1132637 RepID=UPI00239650BC|nr:Peptidase S10 serine carboxypeptidase [Penicillium atrosanguineum]KAJ5304848.1 Peptidase S10 serine carboxypeptidase [Penicillium atrosanguineum]